MPVLEEVGCPNVINAVRVNMADTKKFFIMIFCYGLTAGIGYCFSTDAKLFVNIRTKYEKRGTKYEDPDRTKNFYYTRLRTLYPLLVSYKLPLASCSLSNASKRALKFPLPKLLAPLRCIISKNNVGRSSNGLLNICSR